MNVSGKFIPNKLAKLNDPKRSEYLNPELIWERLALKNPGTLIDIGAGTGFFALHFSRKMKEGRVYACDISDTMLTWMEDHLPADSRASVVPLKMGERSVPLPDGTADLVYMINLHHELEDAPAILKEAGRLLNKGGKLMIIDWRKQKTPEGPPLEIRVEAYSILAQMRECGFANILTYAILPYHHFIVGEKDYTRDSQCEDDCVGRQLHG